MAFDIGGVLKTVAPLAATAFGGPVAGAAAGALFGGMGGKGGAEGISALTSMFAGGAGKAGGALGMQPDIAKMALSLFKEATTPDQKMKLLDVAIAALGGNPAGKAGGDTALSSPGGMNKLGVPANDKGSAKADTAAKADAKKTGGEDTKITYEKSADGSTKITYEKKSNSSETSAAKADSASKASSSDSGTESGLSVKGNTVDTGRYTVEASTKDGGTVKVFDKQTNTFVKAFGDPHVETSDGDKMQFHKNGLSIKLPDGTNVHMKPTETDKNGMAYIDSAMVEKDGKAVTMDGLHGGKAVATSQPKTVTDDMVQDYTTQGQTVLDASSQDVGDLFMTGADGQRTKEITSPKEELNLDGSGGALHTKDGEPAEEAKGRDLTFNPELLSKLAQVLDLTGKNVPEKGMQQDLLKGIQEVLSSFIKPAQDEAA